MSVEHVEHVLHVLLIYPLNMSNLRINTYLKSGDYCYYYYLKRGWARYLLDDGWCSFEAVPTLLKSLKIAFDAPQLAELKVALKDGFMVQIHSGTDDDNHDNIISDDSDKEPENAIDIVESAATQEVQMLQRQVDSLKRTKQRYKRITQESKTQPESFFRGRMERYLNIRGGIISRYLCSWYFLLPLLVHMV